MYGAGGEEVERRLSAVSLLCAQEITFAEESKAR